MTYHNSRKIALRETNPDRYADQVKRLWFQDGLEAAYRTHSQPGFLLGLRIGAIFAILINIGFYFIDRQIPDLVPFLDWIDTWRYQIGVPVFLGVFVLSFIIRNDFVLNIVAFIGMAITVVVVLMVMQPIPVAVKDYYWTGLNILVLYPFLLMNLRFRFALVNGLFVFLMFVSSPYWITQMSHGAFLSAIGVLATALAMGSVGGYLLERYKRQDFLRTHLAELAVNDLQRSNVKLESLSHLDPVTNIHNRRYFDSNYEKEWARCRRDKLSISLLLIDIDRFKDYNDSYGHPAGDHVLKQVARQLQAAIRRPADFVARYGGEEFAVVLADTQEPGARKTAERILADVRDLHISHEHRPAGEEPFITVSIGAASVDPAQATSPDLLIDIADEALYEAKRAGRNRLEFRNKLETPHTRSQTSHSTA